MNETEHLGAFLGSLYHKTTSIDKFFLHVQSDREEIDEKNTIIGSASRLVCGLLAMQFFFTCSPSKKIIMCWLVNFYLFNTPKKL